MERSRNTKPTKRFEEHEDVFASFVLVRAFVLRSDEALVRPSPLLFHRMGSGSEQG